MNSALKTIKKALEVLPNNVLLEVVETNWYYSESGSYLYRGWDEEIGDFTYSDYITEGHTEMYDLFMCNIDTQTGTHMTLVLLQDKRLGEHPHEN